MAREERITGGTPVGESTGVFAGNRSAEDAFESLARIRDNAAATEATRAELAARKAKEAITDIEAIQANLRKFRQALTLAYSGDGFFSRKAYIYNEAVFNKNPSYGDLASRLDVAGKAEKGQVTFYARDNSYAFNVTKDSITHVDANNHLSGQEVNDWYLIAAQNKNWMRSGVTLTGSTEDKAFMKVMFQEILPATTGVKGPKVLNKADEFTPEIMAQARVKAQQYVNQLAAQKAPQQDVPEQEGVSLDTAALKENLKAEILANTDAKDIVFRGDLPETESPETLKSDRDPANDETLRIHFKASDDLNAEDMREILGEVFTELKNAQPAVKDVHTESDAPKGQISGTSGASFMQPLVGDYGAITINGTQQEETTLTTQAQTATSPSVSEDPVAGTPVNKNGEIDFDALRRLDGIIPVTVLEKPDDLSKIIADASGLATAKEAAAAARQGTGIKKVGSPDVAPASQEDLAQKIQVAAAVKTGELPTQLYPALKDHVREAGAATNGVISDFLKGAGIPNKVIGDVTKDAVAKLTDGNVIAPIGNSNRRAVLPQADFTQAASAEAPKLPLLVLTQAEHAVPSHDVDSDGFAPSSIPKVHRSAPSAAEMFPGKQALTLKGMDQFKGAASADDANKAAADADRFVFIAPKSGPGLRGGN